MTDKQIKRFEKFQPSFVKSKGKSKCIVCGMFIHSEMKDCQPCEGAKPVYSKLHKF